MSLHQGIVPDAMKLALVIPIYKAKFRDYITNYRPISLLSNLSKVLENVVYKRLYSFLTHNIGGRRSPAVVCWASDHWVASSNPLRGKFRH